MKPLPVAQDVELLWQRLRLAPEQAGLWMALSQAYAADGLDWQAGVAARQALALDPARRSQAPGSASRGKGAVDAAGGVAEPRHSPARAMLQPTQGLADALPALRLLEAELQGRMGDAQGQFATLQQAIAAQAELRRGIASESGQAQVQASASASAMASSLALSALHVGDLSADRLTALHRSLCAPLEAAAPPQNSFANPRSAGRRLRVGWMAVGLPPAIQPLLLPWLKRIDRSKFELIVYHSGLAQDQGLQACADRWWAVNALDDAGLQRLIVADGVDLLVDLAGHHPGNRLGLFARPPRRCS